MGARTIFIGDVHGCYAELDTMLDKLALCPGKDHLIYLGDLINKGPSSLRVLELAARYPARFILGNHELAFLRAVKTGTIPSKASLLQVFREIQGELPRWIPFLEAFKPFIVTKKYLAVHAGIRPDLHPRETPIHQLCTLRTWDGLGKDLQNEQNPPWYSFYRDPKPIFYGHWAKKGLNLRHNSFGLDSGCVYGKSLSAYILEERRIVSVPARKAYCAIDVT
jgi:hypothetical protein